MSWSFSNLKATSARLKMPTLDELKNTVNSGVQAVNSSVQAVNSSVQEVVKDVNAAGPSATLKSFTSAGSSGSAAPAPPQSSAIESGTSGGVASSFLGKVRGVFDLDSLQAAASDIGVPDAADPMHFPELDLTYITERVAIMSYPATPQRGGTAKTVADFLNKRHGNDYMVWNISERSYDYSVYSGQVVDTKFPGYPAPPIGMLFNLCMAMESWLTSDANNVVVIHCVTGRGRSATVCACLLEWVGRAASAREALAFVLERRKASLASAVVPSQLRYIDMFHEIMEGIRPRYEPLNLKRIAVTTVPNMMSAADRKRSELPSEGGCRPYLQVYKNGKLLFTTSWEDQQKEEGAAVYAASETEGFSMDVDCFVDGDILLRLRHTDTTSGKSSSIFRYGFHTGYVPAGVLRVPKSDLDGASVDPNISDNFCVELEFDPAQDKTGDEKSADAMFDATVSSKASFWDEIARKKQQARQRSASEQDRLLNATKASTSTASSDAGPAGGQGASDGAQAAPGGTDGPAPSKQDHKVEFSLLDDEDEFDEPARSSRVGSGDSTSALFSSLIGDEASSKPSRASEPTAPSPSSEPLKPAEATPEDATGRESANKSPTDLDAEREVKNDSTELRKSSDDDLDALERDLGMGNDEEDKEENVASGPDAGAEDDDDLAELEEYLKEL